MLKPTTHAKLIVSHKLSHSFFASLICDKTEHEYLDFERNLTEYAIPNLKLKQLFSDMRQLYLNNKNRHGLECGHHAKKFE